MLLLLLYGWTAPSLRAQSLVTTVRAADLIHQLGLYT
jgi:hypothetical protein